MRQLLLLTVLFTLLVSCGGKRQIEKALYSGNYDHAISNALKKLETNKDKKRKQKFALMLEDAYQKAVERDLDMIKKLKIEANPEFYKTVFDLYVNLDARQEALKPVLPLRIGRKELKFELYDFSHEITDYRNKVSQYEYSIASKLLESSNKYDAKQSFEILEYIESINPNYKDVRQLMQVAHQKGTNYVLVSIENLTEQVIPRRLEEDLLDFDTYGLDNFWTVYHAQDNGAYVYDYAMQLQLKRINISPERIHERELIREREVVDGKEYKLDADGNVMKDSLGNDIKIDKIINAKCRLFEFRQTKSTQIIADVVYSNLNSNQIIDSFTIDSEFIFENIYARMRGDKRALNKRDRELLLERRVRFPSNEKMVYDTGEDLKFKLKDIINSYRFGT